VHSAAPGLRGGEAEGVPHFLTMGCPPYCKTFIANELSNGRVSPTPCPRVVSSFHEAELGMLSERANNGPCKEREGA
jgi:hypothetical protein